MEPSKEGGHTPYSFNTTTTSPDHYDHAPGSPTYPQSPNSSQTYGVTHDHNNSHGKSEVVPVVEQMENVETPDGLHRGLKLRHMVMIAISGTIGTGLFLTSGKTIATAGPLGARK
jgi:amino acid permease